MSVLTPFFEKLKSNHYSIVTALVLGILTAVYLLIIIPNNEKIEDANNQIVFQGLEVQLKGFFDDKLKEISPEIRDNFIKKHSELANDSVFIDKIEIDTLKLADTVKKNILLIRTIYFKKIGKSDTLAKIKDRVSFDLDEFVKRINSSSNFNSFFISRVTTSKNKEISLPKDILVSKNVSLKDEDSLCLNNRNNGMITFRKSAKRYYTGQVRIPETNFTLFVASGINTSHFQSNVQYIKPNLLIFSLLLIGILFLSICFIKPIVSSHKERLSQTDLIMVAFATGALVALFVIFGMIGFWKTSITERNKSDLKQLVEHIDKSFGNQINILKSWKSNKILNDINDSKVPFRKLYLAKGSNVSLINGDSIMDHSHFLQKIKTLQLDEKTFGQHENLKQIGSLDSYFWMDREGLLTASVSKDNISFPRNYSDRKYFKQLQNKEINTVLTGVFSRESDEYQWIYAEKDKTKNKSVNIGKSAIKGIAFRELFSKEIKLPPDTDYMLVDREGFVLMQNNPNKNLYPNVLLASRNNLVLASILSGCNIPDFRMDYQGSAYQVYAKKVSVKTDLPVYILGMRNLSYLDYLSLFTFSNAFLITVLYGFIIVMLILAYSSLFYGGRLRFFSRHHFYHLFPDSSRKEEYQNLFVLNIVCFLSAIVFAFFSSPIAGVYFALLVGINIAFINVIALNVRYTEVKQSLVKFYLLVLVLDFVFPLVLLYFDQMYLSLLCVIGSHFGLILYYRNWRSSNETEADIEISDAVEKNKGIQRKVYLKFVTTGLINHFVLFPFVLVCAFYSNEINDYARYYCSPAQPKNAEVIHKTVNAYGCDCKPISIIGIGKNNEGAIYKLNFGFERPTLGEVNKYTLSELYKDFYIKMNAVFFSGGFNLFYFLLFFSLLVLLSYSILSYYTNRFFFYGLMQACYEGYYPCKKNELSNNNVFLAMVNDGDIQKMIQTDIKSIGLPSAVTIGDSNCTERKIELKNLFANVSGNEILPSMKMDFILNSNLKEYDSLYSKIWDSIPNQEMQNVLYDFAQDHFLNYKNVDILMELLDLGLVDHDRITGRLKVVSYSFRAYILSKNKNDSEFVKQFEDESKNGTYGKFKLPILIIAISLLLLLMYLNKDSYDKVAILGGGIVTVLGLINKFLDVGKIQS